MLASSQNSRDDLRRVADRGGRFFRIQGQIELPRGADPFDTAKVVKQKLVVASRILRRAPGRFPAEVFFKGTYGSESNRKFMI